jgi:hypothetical protein
MALMTKGDSRGQRVERKEGTTGRVAENREPKNNGERAQSRPGV